LGDVVDKGKVFIKDQGFGLETCMVLEKCDLLEIGRRSRL